MTHIIEIGFNAFILLKKYFEIKLYKSIEEDREMLAE